MPCRFTSHDFACRGAVALALALSALWQSGPARAQDQPVSPSPGNMQRGQRLLDQYQCGSCHTIPGVPAAGGRFAATLDGFGRRSYIAGRLVNRPDVLARWIAQPQALVPGTLMPSMGVAPADARDMAAYLMGLR